MAFDPSQRANPSGLAGRDGWNPSQHPRAADGQFTQKQGTAAEISLSPSVTAPIKQASIVQDVRDTWSERHERKAEVAYRIGAAEAAMRASTWVPGTEITESNKRAADEHLSAQYRLAEALTERDSLRVLGLSMTNAAARATGSAEATVFGAVGVVASTLISAPRKLKMWRLKRFAGRYSELRELNVTVNSSPASREELLDAKASQYVTGHGQPPPEKFIQDMSEFYRLNLPPSPTLPPQQRRDRRDLEHLLANVKNAAREAYLNDSLRDESTKPPRERKTYLAYAPLEDWQGAGHNSVTDDPSRGGRKSS